MNQINLMDVASRVAGSGSESGLSYENESLAADDTTGLELGDR